MDRTVYVDAKGLGVHKNDLNLHFYRPMTQKEKSLQLGMLKDKIQHQYTKDRKNGTVVHHG